MTRSYITTSDDKKLFDDALVKLLRGKFDTRYESLEVTVFSCYSGGFAEMAANPKTGLLGTWSLTTGRSKQYSLPTDGQNRKILVQSGTDIIEPFKVGEFYFHGFIPQYIKALQSDPKITNKILYESADKNDYVDGNPQYRSSGKVADDKTLHSGTKSNHALIFSPASGEVPTYLMPKLVEALEGAGYDAKTEIDFAFDTKKGKKIGKEKGKEKTVTRNTTLKDLNDALDAINKKLEENPGKGKAYIALHAHGNTEKRIAPKKENAVENKPAQGALITPSSGTWTIELDDEFRYSLLEEISDGLGSFLFDDSLYRRVSRPQFLLTTYQESVVGSVEVFLDGLSAGFLSLLNAADGGDYSLDLTDVFLRDLAPYLEDNLIDISFAFGGPDDFFQLTTESDFYLEDPTRPFLFGHFGMGISAGACDGATIVPEPTNVILWGIGIVFLGCWLAWQDNKKGIQGDTRENRAS